MIELVQAQMLVQMLVLVLVLVPNQGQAQALGAGVQPGKALAVGAGDRAGAGADAGAQSGKPQAVARPALGAGTGVHPAKPWQWWPVIELVQAQHWALTRQSPSPGCWCSTRASPGRGGR